MRYFSILVLSAMMVLIPCLSFQFQTNNTDSKYYSANDNSNGQIAVFSADSKPYGLTYGDWTAKWWQWGHSIPKDINPAYDDTGKNCAQNQTYMLCLILSLCT